MSERTSCGTFDGIRLHIALGEPLCGRCGSLTIRLATIGRDLTTRDPQQIRDLRAVIAVLADAMSSKAKP